MAPSTHLKIFDIGIELKEQHIFCGKILGRILSVDPVLNCLQ